MAHQVTARITARRTGEVPPLPHKRCQLRLQWAEEQREPARCESLPFSPVRLLLLILAYRSGFGRMRILWIMAVLLVGVEGNLWQFEMLIMKIAKTSGFMFYSSYGCYCGWGGHGRPQDASDRCCFVHDCCYGKVTGCNPKFDTYTYSEENGVVVCGGDDPCKKQICECDRVAATCFRDNKDTYDSKYKRFPAENCQEDSEPC